MYLRRSTSRGMNGAVYAFSQILTQSIVLNQGCCITTLTLLGLWAGSLARRRESRSHSWLSLFLFVGMRIYRKSGFMSTVKKLVSKQMSNFRSSRGLVLTQNALYCVLGVSGWRHEGWITHTELIEKAAESPQIRLPTVLLLVEELRRQVLQCAENISGLDGAAFFLASDT